MSNKHTINSRILTISRWVLFIPVVIIQAGAFLESEYITWLTGMALCLFLTVHQDKVRKTIRIPYSIILTLTIVIFLTGSYIDIKN